MGSHATKINCVSLSLYFNFLQPLCPSLCACTTSALPNLYSFVPQHLCCFNSLPVYYRISNLHRMPRQLPIELRQNVISILERGCELREISRALHVSLGSVHNIQRVHISSAKLRHRGRPHVMTKAMERSCVLEVTKRRLSTTVDGTQQLKKDFGIQVSTNTIRRALCR